eukprot:scaffold5744_cov33-Phaeocystis_antarctica.AAC.2
MALLTVARLTMARHTMARVATLTTYTTYYLLGARQLEQGVGHRRQAHEEPLPPREPYMPRPPD